MLREIDRHAVGHGELNFDVAAFGHLIGAGVGTVHDARFFNLGSCLSHVFDFDAEVVQTGVLGSALGCRRIVVLELKDGQIYVTVAQVVILGGRRVNPADLL